MNIGKFSVILSILPLALIGAHFFLVTFYASGELRWLVFLAIFVAIIVGGGFLLYKNHLRLVALAEKSDEERSQKRNGTQNNKKRKKK